MSSAVLETLENSVMALTFIAFLCLGEFWGKQKDGVFRTPRSRTQEGQWGQKF